MIIFLLLGLFLPRLAAVILYFLTTWFNGVFLTWYWPVLGFIFMPYTMLWYSAVVNWYGGVWGTWQVVVLVIAAVIDLSSNNKTRRSRSS